MINEGEITQLIKSVERSLYSRIDEAKGEYKLAVGVILQAIMDFCLDDNYSVVPIYRPKEEDITGKMFLEGEGLICWAGAVGLNPTEVYKIAVKAREHVQNE